MVHYILLQKNVKIKDPLNSTGGELLSGCKSNQINFISLYDKYFTFS